MLRSSVHPRRLGRIPPIDVGRSRVISLINAKSWTNAASPRSATALSRTRAPSSRRRLCSICSASSAHSTSWVVGPFRRRLRASRLASRGESGCSRRTRPASRSLSVITESRRRGDRAWRSAPFRSILGRLSPADERLHLHLSRGPRREVAAVPVAAAGGLRRLRRPRLFHRVIGGSGRGACSSTYTYSKQVEREENTKM